MSMTAVRPTGAPAASAGTFPLPGLGLEVLDPPFSVRHRAALRVFSWLPPAVRQIALYNHVRRACMTTQKVVQRLIGGRRPVRIRYTRGPLAGRTFECLTSEKYFLMGASYEADLQSLATALVRSGDVVYDVGAHVGYWSLLFANAAAPDGGVYAFEPSPLSIARMRRNVQDHPAVRPVDAGASDVEGDAFLAERGSESRVVPAAGAHASRIRLVRLDDFVYRDGHAAPTFVKIDIEGAAGACLAGALGVIERARPRLFVEVHHPDELSAVERLLVTRGYVLAKVERKQHYPWHVLATPGPR